MSRASTDLNRWHSLGWRLSLAVAMSGALVANAVAQQPPTQPKPPASKPVAKPVPKPPTAEEKALAEERLRLKEVATAINKLRNTKIAPSYRTGVIAEADKADVDQFFAHYVDSLSSFGSGPEAPEVRQDMRQIVRFFGNAPDKSGHVYVNNLLLNLLEKVVIEPAEKYTPHGRYNCMLAIGELNEVEPTTGGTGPVKAFGPALPVLLKSAMQADAIPAVKVAALVGIQRHAKLGIADKNQERQVVLEMAKLVQQPTPPDTSADGHNWMRRQAIDVLNSIKQPGPNNEAAAALTAIVLDKNNPMLLRLDAARAVGHFKLQANAMGAELTPIVGGLTLDLLKNETNRRALRQGLQSLQMGLKGQNNQGGLIATASGPDRKRADELSQKVAIWLEFVEKVTDPLTIQTEIPNEAALFEVWLAGDENAAAAPAGTP